MTRLIIIVEGQTEEDFVNRLLAPHLYEFGYMSVSGRLMGKQRARNRRGGVRPWPEARSDIINHLCADSSIVVSTMVDFYGMPSEGSSAWPGRAEASQFPVCEKGTCVERGMLAAVAHELGPSFDPQRFVPFVMMHEFEAMLFSDCGMFSEVIGRPDLAEIFQRVRDSFATPEEINDSPETAPSKRIIGFLPSYQKPLLGVAGASEIGLPVIRLQCPHFDEWLVRLESDATGRA